MRVILYSERTGEVRFIQSQWLQVTELLIVLSYNCPQCTHLRNKNIKRGNKLNIAFPETARCMARNCEQFEDSSMLTAEYFSALYSICTAS